MSHKNIKRCSGFTIIEAVVVILVVGVIAVVLSTLQGKMWSGSLAGTDYQAATLAQQKCAEKVIAKKRQFGFRGLTDSVCNLLPGEKGTPATVSLTDGALVTCITSSGVACSDANKLTMNFKDIEIRAGTFNPIVLRIFEY